VRISGFVLIAENIKDIGFRAWFDKAIPAVRFEGKLYNFAGWRILYCELLLNLAEGREHQRKPKRCKQNLSPHADLIRSLSFCVSGCKFKARFA
jgi:hypothetical protein